MYCRKELIKWKTIFYKRFPVENVVTYYYTNDFMAMLRTVRKDGKQVSAKPFSVKHGNTRRLCLDLFHRQLCFTPSRQVEAILREWIQRCDSKGEAPVSQLLPFTEELLFVLFNYFATHGFC